MSYVCPAKAPVPIVQPAVCSNQQLLLHWLNVNMRDCSE